MWLSVLIMTLMLPAVTSQWTQYCPSPRDIQMFDQTFRGPELETMAEIPPLKAMVDDLRGADKEIRMVVTEDILREMSIVVKSRSATGAAGSPKTDFAAFSYPAQCCPKPEHQCTSSLVRVRYVIHKGRVCYVAYSHPFKPYYTQCTCNTCLMDDSCPVLGGCIETDFRYNYLIAYCPHYFPRYVKLLVRIPTNCRCLAGCNRRLEDGDDRNRASLEVRGPKHVDRKADKRQQGAPALPEIEVRGPGHVDKRSDRSPLDDPFEPEWQADKRQQGAPALPEMQADKRQQGAPALPEMSDESLLGNLFQPEWQPDISRSEVGLPAIEPPPVFKPAAKGENRHKSDRRIKNTFNDRRIRIPY